MSNVVSISRGRLHKALESDGWGGAIVGRLNSLPELAISGLQQVINEPDRHAAEMSLPELGGAVRQLLVALRKQNRNLTISRKDIVIWIVCEIVATDVGFDEVYEWLRHEATLQEIVLGQDSTSLLSLLSSDDTTKAIERYRMMQRKSF